MSIVVCCPACGRKVEAPLTCGEERLRCPACETTFVAPPTTSAIQAAVGKEGKAGAISPQMRPEAERRPFPLPSGGPVSQTGEGRAWMEVDRGLGLILQGTYFAIPGLVVALMRLLTGFSEVDLLFPFKDGPFGFCGLTAMLRLVAAIFTIVGLSACCKFPLEGLGKTCALVALVLLTLLVVARMITTPLHMAGGLDIVSWARVSRGVFLGELVGVGVLVLFVREVGKSLGDRRTLLRFRLFVLIYLAVVVLFLARSALEEGLQLPDWFASWGMVGLDEFVAVFALLELACLALLVQQVFLVLAARRAIGKHLRPPGLEVPHTDDGDSP